jgi:hypothetical protein
MAVSIGGGVRNCYAFASVCELLFHSVCIMDKHRRVARQIGSIFFRVK